MTSLARSDDKQKRPLEGGLPGFLFYYCSPTYPENESSLPLARTSLFPNVSSAPPPPKLRPVRCQ
jgi:hypothetical protein